MPVYLSPEWIEEADAALRASGLCTTEGDRFAVEQQVGEIVFHIVFDGKGACMGSGPATDPAVVFRQSWDTAVAVAQGQLSAEEAVLNGEITFEGDPMALLSHRRLLARVDDVFNEVRARHILELVVGQFGHIGQRQTPPLEPEEGPDKRRFPSPSRRLRSSRGSRPR